MLSLPTDDIAHDTNLGTCGFGRAAFAGFHKRMNRSYSEQPVDIVLFADETGTRAAAGFTVLGTYQSTDERLPPATGQTYKLPAGAFFSLRDGFISRTTMYYNLTDWLRQAGVGSLVSPEKARRFL